MCRHPNVTKWERAKYCPNLTKDGGPLKVKVGLQEWNKSIHDSLVGLCFYPRLLIGYEDLVFHIEDFLTKFCECAGGKITDTIKHLAESRKGNNRVHEG